MADVSRAAAMDASSTMYAMLQMGGSWEFTESTRAAMKRDLDAMRELLTQMKCGEQGGKRGFDEWYHLAARVSMAAMVMYLSGSLDGMEVAE